MVEQDRTSVDAGQKVLKPRVCRHLPLSHSVGRLYDGFAVRADVGGVGGLHDPGGTLFYGNIRGHCLDFTRTPELHVGFELGAAVLYRDELRFAIDLSDDR